MTTEIHGDRPSPERLTLYLRLAVGLVFGLLLALLSEKIEAFGHFDTGPKTSLTLWKEALLAAVALNAFIWWAGLGTMRRLPLLFWGLASFGLVLLIAWTHLHNEIPDARRLSSSPDLLILILPILFIAHELISSADQARRPIASYRLYFDQAWKRGVQLALSLVFTGLFWAILWLGDLLLKMIGFDWLGELLGEKYVAMPLTGLAFAASVNLSDVQTRLLDNARALILGILAWLLPVIVALGAIFTVSLFFSGLAPLWSTRAATGTLLWASLILVLLINAAFQQGDTERTIHPVLKAAARLGALLLPVFAALAAIGLSLRIGQYGLTPQRVIALVGVVIALLYGLAYGVAAVWPGRWLRLLMAANIALAFAKLAILIAVLTPIAPPWRVSVDNQVARLTAGKVTPEAFDWTLLRFRTGEYGRAALKQLEASDNAAISARAVEAGKFENERDMRAAAQPQARPDTARLKVVFPEAAHLPQSFLDQTFAQTSDIPLSFRTDTNSIDTLAALIDLDEDGREEILWLENRRLHRFHFAGGEWQAHAAVRHLSEAAVAAFAEGRIAIARPEWNDIELDGERIEMNSKF